MTKCDLIELITPNISELHLYTRTNLKNNTYLEFNSWGDPVPLNRYAILNKSNELNTALDGSGIKVKLFLKKDQRHTIHLYGLNNKNADKVYALLRIRGYLK